MAEYEPCLGTYFICAECGEKFFVPDWMHDGYTYKVSDKWLCSYHCYSKKIDRTRPKRRLYR